MTHPQAYLLKCQHYWFWIRSLSGGNLFTLLRLPRNPDFHCGKTNDPHTVPNLGNRAFPYLLARKTLLTVSDFPLGKSPLRTCLVFSFFFLSFRLSSFIFSSSFSYNTLPSKKDCIGCNVKTLKRRVGE